MERELPAVSLDLLDIGSNRTTVCRQLEFLDAFYGEPGRELFRESHIRGRANGIDPASALSVDAYFFARIGEIYGPPAQSDPKRFYMERLRESSAAIDYLVDRLNGKDKLGQKNEVERLSTRPSDAIKLLALPAGQITPRVKFELRRKLCMAHTAGVLESRSPNGELTDDLFDAQRLLDEQDIFRGPIGKGEYVNIYSFHDPKTLAILGFSTSEKDIPVGVEVKYKVYEMRDGGDIGPILTNGRQKDRASEIVKAFRKAVGNGGIIDPETDVTDSTGIKFVVLDATKRDTLIERVKEALELHPRGVDRIIYDPKSNQDKRLCERYQVYLKGGIVPIELMFYTMREYLHQEYHIGQKLPNGLYDGGAHIMYKLCEGIRPVVPIVFPEPIYGFNPQELILNQQELVATDLRGSNRFIKGARIAA